MAANKPSADDWNTKKKDEDQKDTVERTTDAKIWASRYTMAYNNQKRMFTQFATWYEMMYAIKNYKNLAIWKSKLFIPLMSYKAWTMIAKLLAMRPGFSVKVYDKTYSDEDRKRAEKANLKLEHDYDNPMLDETIRDRLFDTASDTVICGTGFAKAPWVSGTKKYYTHFKNPDGTIDYTKSNTTEVDYGYNDLEPLNVFQVFGAPGKRSWEAKPWIILEYDKTRTELLSSQLYDEDLVKRLKPTGKQRTWLTKLKQSRNKLIGRTNDDQEAIDDTVDSFKVYECYEKTVDGIYLCSFIEGIDEQVDGAAGDDGKSEETDEGNWHNARDEKQPYWHNKYPIVPVYVRRRPHDCWGESIFEITESMATGYNDIVNQLADNLNIVGNGGILMHDTGTTIYDFYYAPGGEVRYSGTKPEFETPTSPDIQLFQAMLTLLEGGIDKATISPYAAGTAADPNDKTQGTAEGINKLQEAAGEIMTFMKSNFMQFLKGVGMRWLSNNRQFLDEDMMLETYKNGKRVPMKVSAEDFTENMTLTIDEALMQPATKEERLNNTLAWLKSMFEIQTQSKTQYDLVAEDPTVIDKPKVIILDLEKIGREISADYGKPDFDQYLYTGGDGDGETQNVNVINSIRAMVDNDEMDADSAQVLIDQIEGREEMIINAAKQATEQAVTSGNATATPEPATIPA